MKVEYTWLTGPTRARDDFLGTGSGLPLPFLVRHGFCKLKKGINDGVPPPITFSDEGERAKQGGYRFYLASVEAEGIPLDLARSFFLPSMLRDGIVVGCDLFRKLQDHCNFDGGYLVPLEPGDVFAHAWNYTLPDRGDDRLIRQLNRDLDLHSELPGDDDILRLLCERYPSPEKLPQMYLILAPWLHRRQEVQKKWHQDRIVLTLGHDVRVRTRSGDVPVSSDYLRSGPIVNFEGFLVPPAAAPLFETDEHKRSWPILTCKKDVIIEF